MTDDAVPVESPARQVAGPVVRRVAAPAVLSPARSLARRWSGLDARVLGRLRWAAVGCWVAAAALQLSYAGVPLDREALILWIMAGLVAATLGRRAPWTVVVDWLPFALALLAYDFARGASDKLGMATWWTPQLDVDRFLFGGTEPTVWLQERLKYPHARWWDVLVSLTYVSFFLLPYVTAGAFWLRSRREFRRWAARFVSLSFLAFALFALVPAAPPWAAARCPAAALADHPAYPVCMSFDPALVADGGLLGPVTGARAGAHAYVERLSGRGWSRLHLEVAQSLLEKGQGTVNLVAAVPSLHAGGTMLFAIFLWRRAGAWSRAMLVAYNLAMGFALVYAAEHYVADILAGWLAAAAVSVGFALLERRAELRRAAVPAADTLDLPAPTASRMEF
jgi:hypothetical protein